MVSMKRSLLGALALLWSSLAQAQGTLPLALTQQFSFTNCQTFTNACGTPLIGGLLYFFQVGTVATQQDSFQDTALTLKNPWPLPLDTNGRVPSFYLANGSIHVRLTDASGVVQFDIANQLVIGPSSGGGGGGSIDPTTILTTGDYKWRPTSEFITGFVKANAQTIGSATSGATGRANADTQALFIYEWTNCPDAHCPVLGGRGATALADFSANKQLTLPDCRSRVCGVGLDDMGNSAAGRLLAGNVTSGGGDGVTTPGANGGEANHTLVTGELPIITPSGTIGGSQTIVANVGSILGATGAAGNQLEMSTTQPNNNITINGSSFSFTGNSFGSGLAHNNMAPFMLGTWYLKL
jgi:hypothetical protein